VLESLEADGSVPAGTHARVLGVLISKLGEDPRCTNVVQTACIDLAEILTCLRTSRGSAAAKVWQQIDNYRLRRLNLGRHSNVSPRFLAERDDQKKPAEAALRVVLREMTKEERRQERRTTSATKSEEFDGKYWAQRLVEEMRQRVNPPPRPLAYTEVVKSNGRSRLIGGDNWWNAAVARKMLFGDNAKPRGTMDALPVATAMRWLLTQLYGHENTISPGSWTGYVKDGRNDIASDLAAIRRLRRRKRQK
jgi:hypothetical protein